MSRLVSCFSQFALAFALAIPSLPAIAQDLDDLPVGTVQNFGPNLQTTANGVCRQPEGLAIDGDGNLYAASNSDSATTVGYICVINDSGRLIDIIPVPAAPGATAIGLLGELFEDGLEVGVRHFVRELDAGCGILAVVGAAQAGVPVLLKQNATAGDFEVSFQD